MNDRELLEMAAKAAGIDFSAWPHSNVPGRPWEHREWNPLTDDGDALRLAVKISQKKPLRLMLPEFNDAWAVVDDYTHDFKIREFNKADHMAATRRAIVRAAAEIGKGMA